MGSNWLKRCQYVTKAPSNFFCQLILALTSDLSFPAQFGILAVAGQPNYERNSWLVGLINSGEFLDQSCPRQNYELISVNQPPILVLRSLGVGSVTLSTTTSDVEVSYFVSFCYLLFPTWWLTCHVSSDRIGPRHHPNL